MRRLWQGSVWNDAQIDPEDHKHRWKLRLWMPLYLATVVLAGIGVANHGSPVLDRTFPDAIVNALGFSLVWFAIVAYIGITFPALWRVEIAGLIATSMMIGAYGAALLFVAESPSSREFLSWLVLGGVVFVFSRLTTLGEEMKERRAAAA